MTFEEWIAQRPTASEWEHSQTQKGAMAQAWRASRLEALRDAVKMACWLCRHDYALNDEIHQSDDGETTLSFGCLAVHIHRAIAEMEKDNE